MNTTSAEQVAAYLLRVKAVKLDPEHPFTWASGLKSPIYCDNRKTLSHPEARSYIRDQFARLIREKYPDAELVAGVATGAIAPGVLVAQELGLPFAYVRLMPKEHGLENQIEGECRAGQRVVVLEDLISTGKSSLQAVKTLRDAGCEVMGMVAIFTYSLMLATNNFSRARCALDTLSDYGTLIDLAARTGYVHPDEVVRLKQWRMNPDTYR
ncbi:MAG: orotate phosphoribosyltransferase [Odoribacteraceae bacterium]|jgi:orotate phosphoribosyltransferase|nr:orotate phosphoribosyltransferase [Odoribacteraceae bacterium]